MIKKSADFDGLTFRKHSEQKEQEEQNCTGADDHNDTCMTESLKLQDFAIYSYILY